MKITTLFTQGSYGTFISWCVYSFSELNSESKIVSPFVDNTGSGHGYRFTKGVDIVCPTHSVFDESLNDYILIECVIEKMINYMDNQYQKDSLGNLTNYINTFFPNINDKLKHNWGSADKWALRELLSFYLRDMIDSTKNQIDKYHSQVQKNNCYSINPEIFLLNISTELEKLLIFFNLKKHARYNLLEYYVSEYLKLQQNFTKSCQIEQFVKNSINNQSGSISNLTIFDEAWIQYKLRLQGYNIKCYNLNEFPLNATELFGLLE